MDNSVKGKGDQRSRLRERHGHTLIRIIHQPHILWRFLLELVDVLGVVANHS